MITLFVCDIVQRLADSKSFLISEVALGYEFSKIFALSGIAAGDNGLVTVTDEDNIEISNLKSHYLFRRENVKHPKSVTAGKAVQKMNPQF
jgi:molybdopterin/thiamine biosynthesis adenylyltransferase